MQPTLTWQSGTYMRKENNNINENLITITGLDDQSYLEFTNNHELVKSKEFKDLTLALKPKEVSDRIMLINLEKGKS